MTAWCMILQLDELDRERAVFRLPAAVAEVGSVVLPRKAWEDQGRPGTIRSDITAVREAS